MRFGRFIFWIGCLAVGAGLALATHGFKPEPLPYLGAAPMFALTDSTGNKFDTSALKGKVWAASFFFTSCKGVCPTVNSHLKSVYRIAKEHPGAELVSISIDPSHDTVPVLAEYAQDLKIEPAKWHLLTGAKAEVDQILITGFKIGSVEDPTLHSTRVVLVDRTGEIRGYYAGTEPDSMKDLKRDYVALLQEPA